MDSIYIQGCKHGRAPLFDPDHRDTIIRVQLTGDEYLNFCAECWSRVCERVLSDILIEQEDITAHAVLSAERRAARIF